MLSTTKITVSQIPCVKKIKKLLINSIYFFYFRPKPAILEESKKFTVFIKNNVEFPKYNVKR